jgi:hypothetical protein
MTGTLRVAVGVGTGVGVKVGLMVGVLVGIGVDVLLGIAVCVPAIPAVISTWILSLIAPSVAAMSTVGGGTVGKVVGVAGELLHDTSAIAATAAQMMVSARLLTALSLRHNTDVGVKMHRCPYDYLRARIRGYARS